ISAPRPCCNGNVYRSAARRNTHFLGPEESQRANVAGVQIVGPYGFDVCSVNLFLCIRYWHHVDMSRVEQATGVVFETKDGGADVGVVGTYPFKYRYAVMQRVREHMYVGVTPGHKRAIEPN